MQISDLEKTPVWARTLSFLVLSGVVGGFFLSAGAAEYVSLGKKHRAPAKQQGGGGGGRGHDIKEDRGGGGGGGGEEPETSDGGGGAVQAPAEAAPKGMTGREAGEFLSGKTIRNTNKALAPYIFFAERGLRADGDQQGAVVRRWRVQGDLMCDSTETGGEDCHDMELTAFDLHGKQPGDVVGWVRTEHNGKLDILLGNAMGFPQIVPFMDGIRPDEMPKFQTGGPVTASGESALTFVLDKPLLSPGRSGPPVAVVFDKANRYTAATPTRDGDKNGKTWVQISVGSWSMDGATLCRQPPDAGGPVCYAPEMRGPATFRLVPVVKGPALDYAMMLKYALPQPAAAKAKPAQPAGPAAASSPAARDASAGGFSVVR